MLITSQAYDFPDKLHLSRFNIRNESIWQIMRNFEYFDVFYIKAIVKDYIDFLPHPVTHRAIFGVLAMFILEARLEPSIDTC